MVPKRVTIISFFYSGPLNIFSSFKLRDLENVGKHWSSHCFWVICLAIAKNKTVKQIKTANRKTIPIDWIANRKKL
jgi:hypothetical protein